MTKSLIFPPKLNVNDKVLIVSPSGKIDKNLITGLKERLISWGLQPIIGKNATAKSGSYAGTIKQRVRDLQYGLNKPEIRALFCSRGGYGAIQLIEHLNLSLFKEQPKWLIGYSDITALHCLLQKSGYASIHAPMARHFTVEPEKDEALSHLKQQLFDGATHYSVKGHAFNKKGEAEGILIGGNFSVLQSLRATAIDINPNNAILYIEDVNENPYAIERMFYNLQLSGALNQLAGLIIGHFTLTREDREISQRVYEYIKHILKPYKFPICFNFPVGHITNNFPLINGAAAKLSVTKSRVELKFG